MKNFYFLSIVILFNCYQGKAQYSFQSKNVDSNFVILTYGLVNYPDKATYAVAKKYGIVYQPAAGCVITKELLNDIERHNKQVHMIAEQKYGKDFWKKFDTEVNAELKRKKE